MIKLPNVRDIMKQGRQESVDNIYNKLSEKAKEYITRDDVEKVYQTLEEELEFNLLTDNHGNVYGTVSREILDDVVFKFMKTIKAMKRGSQVINWSKVNYPNFSNNVDEIKDDMEYYSEVMDFESLFKETSIRGKAQKNVILNILFSLVLNIKAKEYHELSHQTEYKQFKQFIEKVSVVFTEVKNNK